MTTYLARDVHPSTPNPAGHVHGWDVESAHMTSQGRLLYVKCSGCGARRVDLASYSDANQKPLCKVMGAEN